MKITKLLLLEVGTFNDQFQRPFQAHVDGHSMQMLQEATHYGQNLTPAALGAVGSNIMRISAVTAGGVLIPNSFDTPRLCLMMEVEFPGTGGMVQVEWLMGYTDQIGISNMYGNNHISFDRNMQIFFNNVMKGRRMVNANTFGRAQTTSVQGTYQLINHDYRPQLNTLHQEPHLMRPQDVFYSQSMAGARQLLGSEEVIDARPTHGPERVAVSHRRNTVPGQYLSAMLETWKSNSVYDEVDPGSMASQMAASIAEPTIARIRSLHELASVSELRQGGSMTWGQLCGLDDTGTLEDRTVVVMAQSDRHRSSLSQRGATEGWQGNGNATVIASQFVQAVPGMMMALMLTELDFSVTNMTPTGEWDVLFENVQSFTDGAHQVDHVQAFRYKLINELMPGLSRGGLIPLEIHASFNVLGQTFVQINIDGEGFVPYMAPSFCDGLFAPIRAPDSNTLDRFADNLSRITGSLEQDHSAGGAGYEPNDDQFSNNNNNSAGNNSYENSGSL